MSNYPPGAAEHPDAPYNETEFVPDGESLYWQYFMDDKGRVDDWEGAVKLMVDRDWWNLTVREVVEAFNADENSYEDSGLFDDIVVELDALDKSRKTA